MSDRSLPERVAAEIRAELGRAQMTQTALAAALGRSDMYVSRRLSDGTSLDLADLEAIAEALGVPVSRLMPAAEPAERAA